MKRNLWSWPRATGITFVLTYKLAFAQISLSKHAQSFSDSEKAALSAESPIQNALPGKLPALSEDNIARYQQAHPNTPDAAVAVFLLNHDSNALLKSAALHPGHATLQLTRFRLSKPPEEKESALAAFSKADPKNALGPYLKALQHTQAGKPHDAISELVSAESLRGFSVYSEQITHRVEDAYRHSGFSEAISKVAARSIVPHAGEIAWEVFNMMASIAGTFEKDGDEQGAIVMHGMQIDLARRLQNSSLLEETIEGFRMQKRILEESAPGIQPPIGLNDADYEAILTGFQKWMKSAGEDEILRFFELAQKIGEYKAARQILKN
ncbi:MAG: hypothetical protein WCO60_03225 [Verrucomicrobiota bacterium]